VQSAQRFCSDMKHVGCFIPNHQWSR